MSEKHINDIVRELSKHKWTITSDLPGDGLMISRYWIITNPRQRNIELKIAFEGMDDLEVLPIEKCYGCYLVTNKAISLYFSKNNPHKWKKDLSEFVDSL